jgi:hypothetical protein
MPLRTVVRDNGLRAPEPSLLPALRERMDRLGQQFEGRHVGEQSEPFRERGDLVA